MLAQHKMGVFACPCGHLGSSNRVIEHRVSATYLENFFLSKALEPGYNGDFIGEYLLFVIYPNGLTWQIQIWLGVGLICFNGIIYSWVWRKRKSVENSMF